MSETSSHGDGAVDRAIDRAVRQLMEAEPPPGLRGRVLARLETPAPSMFPRLAIAVGALAVIVLAVLVLRPSPRPETETARTEPVAPPAVAAPARPSAARSIAVPEAAPPVAAVETPRSAVTREAIPMPQITNLFGAQTVRANAAAAPIEDVVFPTAEAAAAGLLPPVVSIPVPQITIEPLHVEALRVAQPTSRK